MRVLLVTPETPWNGGGGIATYAEQVLASAREAGWQVHVLTWSHRHFRLPAWGWIKRLGRENVTALGLSPRKKPAAYQSLAAWASAEIARALEALLPRLKPDLIEGTDYLAPLHDYLVRRRAGLTPDVCPVVTFNHGMSADVWDADARWTTDIVLLEDFSRELVQMRLSDRVVCPSRAAAGRLASWGIDAAAIDVLPEPYAFANEVPPGAALPPDPHAYAYIGRVSFGKGADALAAFLNAAGSLPGWQPETVRLFGHDTPSGFGKQSGMDLLKRRLAPTARSALVHASRYERAGLPALVRPAAWVLNFSRWETFSYTAAEAIACGAVLLTHQGSAMAEFVPEDLRDGVFATAYPSAQEIDRVLRFWWSERDAKLARLQAYARERCAPQAFLAGYAEMADRAQAAHTARSRAAQAAATRRETVSALIAHRNDAKHLPAAVESILRQSEPVDEIIVFDDGSDSPDVERALTWVEQLPRVRVIRHHQVGLCGARNALIESAGGDLMFFLDSDDLLEPLFVQKTRYALAHAGADAAIAWRQNFDEDRSLYPYSNVYTPFLWVYNHYRMTALIRTRVLRDIGFDRGMRMGEADDWLFWLEFVGRGYEAVIVPEPLFLYRFRKGSMSWPWSEGQTMLTADAISAKGWHLGEIVPTESSLRAWWKKGLELRAKTLARGTFK